MLSPLQRRVAVLTATVGVALSIGAGTALADTTATTGSATTGSGDALAAQLYQVSPLLADLACIAGGAGFSYSLQGPVPAHMMCSDGSTVAY